MVLSNLVGAILRIKFRQKYFDKKELIWNSPAEFNAFRKGTKQSPVPESSTQKTACLFCLSGISSTHWQFSSLWRVTLSFSQLKKKKCSYNESYFSYICILVAIRQKSNFWNKLVKENESNYFMSLTITWSPACWHPI